MSPIVQQYRAFLSPTQRLVLDYIERATARRHADSFFSSETIAQAVGCCVRSVQLALRHLSRLGLIRVIRDLGLKTRRRIQLLWRRDKPPIPEALSPNSVGANSSHREVSDFAPTRGVPPHPPIEESEDDRKRDGDDDDENRPSLHIATSPPPAESSSSQPVSSFDSEKGSRAGRKSTPEEKAAMVAKAEALFGAGIWTRSKTKRLALLWGLSWVSAALDQAAAAKKRTGRMNWGYITTTLVGFKAEGGPPPPEPAAKTFSEARADYMRRHPEEADRMRRQDEETDRLEEEMWAAHLAREEARKHAPRLV